MNKELKNNKLRVWWNPQIGAVDRSFRVPIETPEEGKKVLDILAAYDAYQLQNKIKPDYCNCGGIEQWNSETKEWEDWYLETEDDYFDDIDEYINSLEYSDKLEVFAAELYSQIDWDSI